MVKYEIRGVMRHSTFGYDIFKNGIRIDWSVSGEKTVIRSLEVAIRRESSDGGIIVFEKGKDDYEVITVRPCPTNHARVVDDFMGGSVCLDCRAVW